MSTEQFSLEMFTQALYDACVPHNIVAMLMSTSMGDEYWYDIEVKNVSVASVHIRINSSVLVSTGMSAATGENSIRAWLTDGDGNPLGSKVQRWITRQSGWQSRLADMVTTLVTMGQSLRYCNACRTLQRIFIVKKDGPYKGRYFKTCLCDKSFEWIDLFEQSDNDVADVIPTCPKCDGRMVLRESRYGKFWGCANYPSCNGTRSIIAAKTDVTTSTDAPKPLTKPYTADDIPAQSTRQHAPNKYVPSEYTQSIVNYVNGWFDGSGSSASRTLVINALAGTGKTTTGKEIVKQLPRSVTGLSVAFGKAVALELRKVMPRNVRATTIHSMGLKAYTNMYPLTDDGINPNKVKILLQAYMDMEEYGHLVSVIEQIVSLVKANLSDVDDISLDKLVEYYGVLFNTYSESDPDYDLRDFVYPAVRYVIETGLKMTNMIDMDDMVYMPIMLNAPCQQYDFIFGDEVQDWNKADLELVLRHSSPTTRHLFVGDRYQSMYGFRGADVNSIQTICNRMDAEELPLPMTYRSPKLAVEMVNDMFPHIGLVAAPWAIDGVVKYASTEVALNEMVSGDMVLCRTNAPLMKICISLIGRGIKATVRGKSIGTGLVVMIQRMQTQDVVKLLDKLQEYKTREVAKLMAADKASAAQQLDDIVETIVALSSGCITVQQIIDRIFTIFSDDATEGVVCSSIHKAKGLEADRVYLVKPELMPHPAASSDWELQQECNIAYVALTRWKKQLTFVGGVMGDFSDIVADLY